MRAFAIRMAQRKGLLMNADPKAPPITKPREPVEVPQRRGLLSAETVERKMAKRAKKGRY